MEQLVGSQQAMAFQLRIRCAQPVLGCHCSPDCPLRSDGTCRAGNLRDPTGSFGRQICSMIDPGISACDSWRRRARPGSIPPCTRDPEISFPLPVLAACCVCPVWVSLLFPSISTRPPTTPNFLAACAFCLQSSAAVAFPPSPPAAARATQLLTLLRATPSFAHC